MKPVGARANWTPAKPISSAYHEYDADHLHKTARQPAIGVRQPFEAAVEALEARSYQATWPGGTRLMGRLMRLEQDRTKGGTECQRDKAGDHGRGRDRSRELAKEQARDAREEGGRDEHRTQRQGNRDQRAADLVHRHVRSLFGRHPALQVALDVLDHDDRAIHDDPHSEHQSEQRKVIQRYPERVEKRKRANKRDWYRDDRDDRGAPPLQEQEDDTNHEQNRDENRDDHLLDRFADKSRRIVDDFVANTGREFPRQALHGRKDLVLHRQRVRPGLGEDQQRQTRAAIRERGRPVICGANLDASDVADARYPSLSVGFENEE